MSLHLHSFLQPELSFSAGELHGVCRQWAITLAKQTWAAAQEDHAQPNPLRSVDEHGRLIQLAACFGSDRPSLSVAVQTMSERLLLQLLHSRPVAGVSMAALDCCSGSCASWRRCQACLQALLPTCGPPHSRTHFGPLAHQLCTTRLR